MVRNHSHRIVEVSVRKFRTDAPHHPSRGAECYIGRAAPNLPFGVQHFPFLVQASLAAREFVYAQGLGSLNEPNLSRQRLAAAYEAAFSVDDRHLPPLCREFCRIYEDAFRELFAARDTATMELSPTHDLARRSCFMALRNGLDWHRQWIARGRDPQFQICAFPLADVRSALRRHCPAAQVRLPALGIESVGLRGYDSDPDYEAVREQKRTVVREEMAELPFDEQRLIRMAYGFFPCTNPYSLDRAAKVFGRDSSWARATLHRGLKNLERRLRQAL